MSSGRMKLMHKEGRVMKLKPLVVVSMCLCLAFCASSQKKLAKSREKDPQYQYNVGLFYMNSNSIDEAIKYLNKSLALNPRFFLSWNALGLARSMKGDMQGAIAGFRKCLEINPQFSEARNNLGTIYQEMKMIDQAEQEFRKAIENPSYSSLELPHYNLARLYFTLDRIDDAYNEVQSALQIKNRFALAHNLKGLILEKKGNLEEAVDSYEAAYKIVPDDVNFGFNLGLAYYKNDEPENAEEIFEKISPRVQDQEMKDRIKEYLDLIRKK